jgi:hypothetical protein
MRRTALNVLNCVDADAHSGLVDVPQETSTMPVPRRDGPSISTTAPEGKDVITAGLSELLDGHSRIARKAQKLDLAENTRHCQVGFEAALPTLRGDFVMM